MKDTTKSFIARNKLRLFLGVGFIGIFLSMFGYLTFAKVWSSTFEYYGIPILTIYFFGPVVICVGCWALGYWYETQKIWAFEISHQNQTINPEFEKVCKEVDEIHRDIQEIKEGLKKCSALKDL